MDEAYDRAARTELLHRTVGRRGGTQELTIQRTYADTQSQASTAGRPCPTAKMPTDDETKVRRITKSPPVINSGYEDEASRTLAVRDRGREVGLQEPVVADTPSTLLRDKCDLFTFASTIDQLVAWRIAQANDIPAQRFRDRSKFTESSRCTVAWHLEVPGSEVHTSTNNLRAVMTVAATWKS